MTSPTLSTPRRLTWRTWLILWLIVAALEALLLANNASLDTLLWRSTRWFTGDQDTYSWSDYKQSHANDPAPQPFYNTTDPPFTRAAQGKGGSPVEARFYKRTEKIWRVLRDLGEPFVTLILLAALAIYDRRRWKASLLLLTSTIAAGGLATLIRVITGRLRPNGEIIDNLPSTLMNEGDNYWQLFRGFHTGADLSFPSGHATLAFATAATLTYLSPKGKWLFLTIATGTALSRVVMQAHFYSDTLFGAAFGYTTAWLTTQLLDRMIPPKATQT